MLSYRHGFHAGNVGDLLKHIVVTDVLDHLRRKSGGFDFIDTHAGAGLYDLRHARAAQLREYAGGIGRLAASDAHAKASGDWRRWWPELQSWFAVLDAYNVGEAALADCPFARYPGSPAIAMHGLRDQDRAWFFELHPRDHETLVAFTAGQRRIKVLNEDGFGGLLGLVPPASRRALVLIDPSYEIKADYELAFTTVAKAYRKFATGTYVLWYPVVDRHRIQRLERQFVAGAIRNVLQLEIGVSADAPGRGMTATGVFVVNPPWTMRERMTSLLPRLRTAVGQDDGAFWRCVQLVDE